MLSLGFLYVVEKPFSSIEIQAIVKRALGHCHAKRQNRKVKSGTEIRYNPDSFRRLQEAALAFKVAVGQ